MKQFRILVVDDEPRIHKPRLARPGRLGGTTRTNSPGLLEVKMTEWTFAPSASPARYKFPVLML
jgi:hypothetical protein